MLLPRRMPCVSVDSHTANISTATTVAVCPALCGVPAHATLSMPGVTSACTLSIIRRGFTQTGRHGAETQIMARRGTRPTSDHAPCATTTRHRKCGAVLRSGGLQPKVWFGRRGVGATRGRGDTGPAVGANHPSLDVRGGIACVNSDRVGQRQRQRQLSNVVQQQRSGALGGRVGSDGERRVGRGASQQRIRM